ncbi:hypothetical protein BpHYR1_003567 [Brachionus plicatilis]|uniref:Uncharacterized protein n=1 Tax=Brachionus plicatilis TaxID=10195 RepID=A0A3M7QDN4_BRAPC|nr:hypothetical protein BpHYR1_003567 [Brachionus plicatilis]
MSNYRTKICSIKNSAFVKKKFLDSLYSSTIVHKLNLYKIRFRKKFPTIPSYSFKKNRWCDFTYI